MFEVTCLDNKGNPITHLTQWDINQTLLINLDSLNLASDNTPKIHFCNKESKKALVVESTISNNKLSAHIPNDLLRVPYKITAYLYLEENDSGKTIYTIEMPVNKRPQPSDYVYNDDLHLISVEDILSEVEEIRNSVQNEQIEISNLITTITNNEATRNSNEQERNKVFQEKLEEINNIIEEYNSLTAEDITYKNSENVKQALDRIQNALNEISMDAEDITYADGQSVKDALDNLKSKLTNDVGVELDFNEGTNVLKLLNSVGEQLGDAVTILTSGLSGIQMETIKEIDDNGEDVYYLVISNEDGEELTRCVLPATGGGGSTSFTTMRVRNLLPSTYFTVPYSDGCTCELKFSFTSIDSDGYSTGNGMIQYQVGGVTKLTQTNVAQGDITIDIGKYLVAGKTNVIKVIVTDAEGTKKTLTYNVTVSENYITSTFASISKQTGSFSVSYTPVGSGTKTIHFVVDGEEINTKSITSSNRVQYETIPTLSHGSHILEIYMTTLLDGYTEEIKSNTLSFGVISIEEGNELPIVYLKENNADILQYSTVESEFLVYDPSKTTCDVECYFDNELVTSLRVNSESHIWSYRVMVSGEHTFAIKYGDITKSYTVNATEVNVAQAETSGLKFYFTASNRSNNEQNPAVYEYINEDNEKYSVTFNNMNFSNDGWTGSSLDIGVGSSIDIDCKPFENDVTGTIGKTIEFNFKAKNVYNYDSLIISCFANEKGIHITPNNGSLSINSNDVVDIQYKDEEEIKISFVISIRNSANEGQKQLIYVYVNGNIAGILRYSVNDNFSQLNASGIHIGSDDAGIELYNIRFYEVELSSYQILDNFIADTPDPVTMIERNNRNDIFDDNNDVDYDKLPENCPYLIVSCPELPQYKGDKKTGVYGRFVDKQNPEKSFTFTGAEIDVQGTSSAGYYVKNFKINYKGGFTLENDEVVSKYPIYNEETDIPVSKFCYKADVASSEGANNIVLMKLWEETVPYQTTPQLEDSRVRQAINGRPIVLFWENTSNGELSFRGKYNFNNDKGTAETFGFVDDENHNCQCWEFKDNGLALTEFRGNDFDSLNSDDKPVWQDAFESRFPEDFTDTTKLKRVVSWVVSTDTTKATNNNLLSAVTYDGIRYTKDTAEYRLAKFKAEFEDYFIKTPVLYYYLYTDLFLMTDSRAKNQFITTWDGIHWMFIPYDGDTALGIDNVGALKFGYWLEDTDTVNGNDVYNGQPSVLWNNVRNAFADDISTLAQEVISQGKLTYEYVSNKFNEHQSAWSEAIFCADTMVKYINPYLQTGTNAYLDMAQGSKRTQRDYWLFHRFNYWCSKYHVGTARNEFITLRMSEPQGDTVEHVPLDMTLHITPYEHTYVSASFGQSLQKVRGYANQETVIESGLDRPSDSPVYIFNAGQLKDIGDLSSAYVRYCDISAAKNLEKLVLGNPIEGYNNESLNTLGIGNNRKLRLIDVRNCSNLSGSIAAGSCNNIEEIYADGTQITSVSLPVGGTLKVLRLPETISSLTIRKQQNIEELYVADYKNLSSLFIEDCPTVDVIDILNSAQSLTNVYLTDVNWNLSDTTLLDRLLELGGKSENGEENTNQSVLTGVVHVPVINTRKWEAYTRAWKNLTITYDTFIQQYPVTFQNYDGTVLCIQYVDRGEKAVEPISNGIINIPIRESSVDTVYTFDGWNTNLDVAIIGATTIIAVYAESVRQYTVKFNVEGTIVQETKVDAYGTVEYEGDMPIKTGLESSYIYYLFEKWDDEAINVTKDMTLNALFLECVLPSQIIDVTQFDYVFTDNPEHTSAYTLTQFYAICKSDRFKDYLSVGDEIELMLSSEEFIIADETIVFQVYGFNHYELADSEDMAHVVFGMKGVLNQTRQLNSTNTNVGGWDKTVLRTFLNSRVITMFDSQFSRMMETVKILASSGNTSTSIITSLDRLFLFSQAEVGFNVNDVPYKNEISAKAENVTFALFVDNATRIKRYYNGTGNAVNWWLRSTEPTHTTSFSYVYTNGAANYYYANNNYGVAFGFCI